MTKSIKIFLNLIIRFHLIECFLKLSFIAFISNLITLNLTLNSIRYCISFLPLIFLSRLTLNRLLLLILLIKPNFNSITLRVGFHNPFNQLSLPYSFIHFLFQIILSQQHHFLFKELK